VNRRCIISSHREDAQITIGNSCGFSGVTIAAAKSIKIGENVLCGANVVITDFDWHSLDPHNRLTQEPNSLPIEIGNNVWLGLDVVVLKGASIGSNTVIGACSLVTGHIPDNVIAAGNPCRIIKPLMS